jgi:ATP-dependent Clp protease protease subunit
MTNKDTREIFIYTEFGPAWAGMVDATLFAEQLKELGGGDVNLRINSYGGSVDEALAIISMLQRHDGQVSVTIDSIAASAASLFGAAFGASIARHARVMIHNPLMMTYGNAHDHAKSIEVLNTYTESLVDVYATAMPYEKDEIKALLDAETWYTAQAAVDAGLASEIVDPEQKVEARTPKVVTFKKPIPELNVEEKEPEFIYDCKTIAAKIKLLKLKAKKI